MSQNQSMLPRVMTEFRTIFPEHDESFKSETTTFTAKSGQGIVELEMKRDLFQINLIYVGWCTAFVFLQRPSNGVADQSLYAFSYGPGTDTRFHYPRLYRFIGDYWPELLKLIPNDQGSVPSMGIRDLAELIPANQRMDPNSAFMFERACAMMRATQTYIYKGES